MGIGLIEIYYYFGVGCVVYCCFCLGEGSVYDVKYIIMSPSVSALGELHVTVVQDVQQSFTVST